MALTSPEFLIFTAIILALYYILPKKTRRFLLALSSLAFYASAGLSAVVYIFALSGATFFSALRIERLRASRDEIARSEAKLNVAAISILAVGLLFALKYLSEIASHFALPLAVLGFGNAAIIDITAPLGISFYIFKSIGYIVDVYRKKHPAERNFIRYFLFVSYFPELVQGPISRYGELSEKLDFPDPDAYSNIRFGLQRAALGYMKKLIIADRAAVVVNKVLPDAEVYGGALTLFAMFFYCIQLYCDFSGGIDIARGVSQMFGVALPENFRRPLFADSLADYWRRWHITLGSWMRDYVFYPLSLSKPLLRLGKLTRKRIGGKAGKLIPTSCATFTIYFLIGIWHGLSLKYIIFGLWNGVLITASLLLEGRFKKIKATIGIKDGLPWRIFCIVRTNIIVVAGRFLTRADSLAHALLLISLMFTSFDFSRLFDGTLMSLGLTVEDFVVIAAGALLLVILELIEEAKGESILTILSRRGLPTQLAVIITAGLAMLFFGIFRGDYIASEFIYKQF